MVFAAAGVSFSLICWLGGSWKSWKMYYPTILFFLIGNETCDLLLHKKPLWGFTDVFGHYTFLLIALMLLLYPGTVILFLSYFPQKALAKIAYILLWVAIYSGVELVSSLLKLFAYHGGWNIYFTILHNAVMFLLIRLHFKKPLLAWPAAFLLSFLIIWYFHIPLEV